MDDQKPEQAEENAPEEQPAAEEQQAPARRKPGFFSRLFTVTETEAPAEEAVSNEPVPDVDEVADAPLEDEKKEGYFKRLFGKKKEEAEEEEQEAPPPEEEPVAAAAEEIEPLPKKSWFRRLMERLGQTRRSLIGNIRAVLGLSGKLDEETVEELEAVLIQSDVAVPTTQRIIERMKSRLKRGGGEESTEGLLELFKESVRDILENSAPGFEPKAPQEGPYVVMVVGVNGVGKTTTVAKMAKRCQDAGLNTMLVAGDTFRAAAVEQLEIWAERTECDFVKAPHGADAAALCYDAMAKAKARGTQVVFIDTAGRLHTKTSLMDELGKIERVIQKQIPDAPHETLLVLDATTGQNAIQQVKLFNEAVKVTGLVMTKLDGTARGGVLLSVLDMFRIPITLIGVGEGADDLRDFDPDEYARALFGEEEEEKEED